MANKMKKYLFLILLLPLHSYGDIYKCESNDGGVTYSDLPCKNIKKVIDSNVLVSLNIMSPTQEKIQEKTYKKRSCELNQSSKNEIQRRYKNLESEIKKSKNIGSKRKKEALLEVDKNKKKALSAHYNNTAFWSTKVEFDQLVKSAREKYGDSITFTLAMKIISIESLRDSAQYLFDKNCQLKNSSYVNYNQSKSLDKEDQKVSSPLPYIQSNIDNGVTDINHGAINVSTGIFMPSTGAGIIDPTTGTVYVDVGGGYVNTRTGSFSPKL